VWSPPLLERDHAGASNWYNTFMTKELPSIKDLFTQTWSLFTSNWKIYTSILIIPAIISYAASLFINELSGQALGEIQVNTNNFLRSAAIMIIVVLFLGLLQGWSQAAMLIAIKHRKEKINAIEAYKRAKSKALPFWIINFLYGLTVVGGMLLLIVPGLIFMVWYTFATYIFIDEGITGINALLKSKEYVKNNLSTIATKFFPLVLAPVGVSYVADFMSENVDFPALNTFYFISTTLFSFVWVIILAIYLYLLYETVKASNPKFAFESSRASKVTIVITSILPILLFVILLATMIFLPQQLESSLL